MAGFEIATETFEGGIVLRLTGSAGIAAAEAFAGAVMRATAVQPALVVVDLAGVTDISSLFAGQLIGLHNGLKHHAGRAALANASPRVAEALRRMRIDVVVPMFDSLAAARQ